MSDIFDHRTNDDIAEAELLSQLMAFMESSFKRRLGLHGREALARFYAMDPARALNDLQGFLQDYGPQCFQEDAPIICPPNTQSPESSQGQSAEEGDEANAVTWLPFYQRMSCIEIEEATDVSSSTVSEMRKAKKKIGNDPIFRKLHNRIYVHKVWLNSNMRNDNPK